MIMPVREILQLGNPALLEKSRPVKNIDSSSLRVLIVDLRDTLLAFRNDHGFGRAIAAPQIGMHEQIIYVNLENSSFAGALINPVITRRSKTQREIWDSCFSFPELMVRVSRSEDVTVNYVDENGTRTRLDADGDLAELLQHEIDHLEGILAVKRAISPTAFMTRTEWLRQAQPE
ncbi:MAG: peptide deformylase [Candidatus Zixiibacteriota bacterium]|nr:MAG: peptide deformylase [candidate division Zixibacteria bacterium]